MLRICEMFVLLLVVLRGSLVVSSCGNVIDVGSLLGNSGSGNAATSIADISKQLEDLRNAIAKLRGESTGIDLSNISSLLGPATNLSVPTGFLQILSSKLSEQIQFRDLFAQITGSIANFRTTVEKWSQSNQTAGDAGSQLCKSANVTELPKLLSDVYDLVKAGVSNNQNSGSSLPKIVTGTDSTKVCNASSESLQQLIAFIGIYKETVKSVLVKYELCRVLGGANDSQQYNDESKATKARLLKTVQDLEKLLQPVVKRQLKTIRNCGATVKLSEQLLAVIAKLWPSIGQIGIVGGIGDKISGIFDSGHIGSGLLKPKI